MCRHWLWHLSDGLNFGRVYAKALVCCHMPDERHCPTPEVDLVAIQLDTSLSISLEKLLQIVVVISSSHFMGVAKPNHNEIICNHLNTTETFEELVHSSLKHFWCRAEAKGHSLPAVSSKWSIECGEEGGFLFHLYMPESLGHIQHCEHFGPVESSSNILNSRKWIVFPTDGLVEISRV